MDGGVWRREVGVIPDPLRCPVAHATGIPNGTEGAMNLEQHLKRHIAFSRAAFGPGERRKGCCDHIMREIEIEILPETVSAAEAASEWVDVVILALNGLTRALVASGMPWERVPFTACQMIEAKQTSNEQRDWPDWRTADPEKAIEHIRYPEATAAQDGRPCTMESFVAALMREGLAGTVLESAIRAWIKGDWRAALFPLSDSERARVIGESEAA